MKQPVNQPSPNLFTLPSDLEDKVISKLKEIINELAVNSSTG